MRVDRISIASGAVTAALGALVLLDSVDAVELSLGWMAVVLTASVGALLVISGLVDGGGRHHRGR